MPIQLDEAVELALRLIQRATLAEQERDRLKKREEELLKRNTELLEENRAIKGS